jgi:hypothetical protein
MTHHHIDFTAQDAAGFFPTLSHLLALVLDWLRPGT